MEGLTHVPVNLYQGVEQEIVGLAVAGLPPSPLYDAAFLGVNEAPDTSRAQGLAHPDYGQIHVANSPLNPQCTRFEQLPLASLPASRAPSGWREALVANQPLSLAYAGRFPDAELFLADGGFVNPWGTAYPDAEQVLFTNLPSSPAWSPNHAALSSYGEIPNSLFNGLLPPQPQSGNDIIQGDCQRLTDGQQVVQTSLPSQFESNTLYPSCLGQYDGLNCLPSSSEQTLGVRLALATSTSGRKGCIRCRKVKKVCIKDAFDGESRCLQCVLHKMPPSICSQDHDITHILPFNKCLKIKPVSLFHRVRSNVSNRTRVARLRHYPNGPFLDVECCKFSVTKDTDMTQNFVLRKNTTGWYSMETTSYRLTNPQMDISSYLQDCVRWAIDEACSRYRYPTSFFFKQARVYEDEPVIQWAFEFFALERLHRIGLHFRGNESLEMPTVNNRGSIFHRFKVVPRMIQNQVSHLEASRMRELEKMILKAIRNIMRDKRSKWPIGFLAIFIVLHVREIELGRLIYWHLFFDDLSPYWIYLSKPSALIEELIASCNSLLSHFHLSWREPLHQNWDDQKSKDMVDNDSRVISTMKALQVYISKLRKDKQIGRKARNLFRAGNPNSVDFTASSLLFASISEGCEVRDFY